MKTIDLHELRNTLTQLSKLLQKNFPDLDQCSWVTGDDSLMDRVEAKRRKAVEILCPGRVNLHANPHIEAMQLSNDIKRALRKLHPIIVAYWAPHLPGKRDEARDAIGDVLSKISSRDEPTIKSLMWMYEQAMKGMAWEQIRLKLKKKPMSWLRYDTPQGVRQAVLRYALKEKLPTPPPRKAGRRKNVNT